MSIDDYLNRVDQIAAECLAVERSSFEVVAEKPDHEELASFRLEMLNNSDVSSCVDFLSTGLFSRTPQPLRLGLILLTLDIDRQITRLDIRGRCQRYDGSTLISNLPGLSDYVRDDLILCTAIESFGDSDVVKVASGFAQIDAVLNPAIAGWACQSFPRERVRVRLDPRTGGKQRPKGRLVEYVVRPPNPTWWRRFGLRRGTTDSGCFALDPETAPHNLREIASWEYAAKGIRRLEVFVKRENQGRFSMMVEELSVRDQSNGFTIGRCIHLDSESPEGTPFEEAVLDHIDLAINVYEQGAMQARFEQGLHDAGKVIDASCRTHLLRIDGPQFPVLFDCAIGFLQSKTLFFEWLYSQFPSDSQR